MTAAPRSRTARKWSREPVPLGDALREYLRDSGIGARLRHAEVFEAWRGVVGARIAKRSTPVRFERGELLVLVESAALLHELRNFTGDRYRTALNRALGEVRVHKLSFQPKR